MSRFRIGDKVRWRNMRDKDITEDLVIHSIRGDWIYPVDNSAMYASSGYCIDELSLIEEEEYKEHYLNASMIKREEKNMSEFKVGDRVSDVYGDEGVITGIIGDHIDVTYDNTDIGENGVVTSLYLGDPEDPDFTVIELREEENEARDGAILALFTSKELLDELNRRL